MTVASIYITETESAFVHDVPTTMPLFYIVIYLCSTIYIWTQQIQVGDVVIIRLNPCALICRTDDVHWEKVPGWAESGSFFTVHGPAWNGVKDDTNITSSSRQFLSSQRMVRGSYQPSGGSWCWGFRWQSVTLESVRWAMPGVIVVKSVWYL